VRGGDACIRAGNSGLTLDRVQAGVCPFGVAGIFAVHRLWRACINSWNGLRAVARSEEAFRQEVLVFIIAVPLAFLITTEMWKRLALILVIVFVMVIELLNTAIEKLGDRVSLDPDPRMAFVKDLGSAAVGVALLVAGAVWLLALAERLGLL
jgi:diacylglycerol kinase (ATP)